MRTHELKTWPALFQAILDGRKTFEIRLNDRDYAEGDVLDLKEHDPATATYSGRSIQREVTYILVGGQFGIDPGWVVLGIRIKEKT